MKGLALHPHARSSRIPTETADDLTGKHERLLEIVRSYGSVIVAYSGGVDSTLVAEIAHIEIGPARALIVTADSPSLAQYELEAASTLAQDRGWNLRTIATAELQDERYARNDGARCYYCKNELYEHLSRIASQEGITTIVNGANRDDLSDYRPGMEAAKQYSVRSPLVDAEFGKDDIRRLARALGLPNWEKPAQPCLSSRIPYGTTVTVGALQMISDAERHLRSLGFEECRVRHHGDTAKVEIPLKMMARYREPSIEQQAIHGIIAAGYQRVELDPEGLRSGNLNSALKATV